MNYYGDVFIVTVNYDCTYIPYRVKTVKALANDKYNKVFKDIVDKKKTYIDKKSRKFDTIVYKDLYSQMTYKMIIQIYEFLKPSGRLIIATPSISNTNVEFLQQYFTKTAEPFQNIIPNFFVKDKSKLSIYMRNAIVGPDVDLLWAERLCTYVWLSNTSDILSSWKIIPREITDLMYNLLIYILDNNIPITTISRSSIYFTIHILEYIRGSNVKYFTNIAAFVNYYLVTIPNCPYCLKAEQLLDSNNIKFFHQELKLKNAVGKYILQDAIILMLQNEKVNISTVTYPIIFHKGKYIGGYDQLKEHLKSSLPEATVTSSKFIGNPLSDKQIDDLNFVAVSKQKEDVTKFGGYVREKLLGMLYLIDKFPNDCLVLPESIIKKGDKILRSSIPSSYFNFCIVWDENFSKFVVPSNYVISIQKCIDKADRFVMIPFIIRFKNIGNTQHSNFLVYDKKTRSLERFDPVGYVPSARSRELGNHPESDFKLIFNGIMGYEMVRHVYDPIDFCPIMAMQKIQKKENEQIATDPEGFCVAWSLWYADMRLSNPDMSRKQVVELSLNKLRSDYKSFTKFIRGYSNFVLSMTDKYFIE